MRPTVSTWVYRHVEAYTRMLCLHPSNAVGRQIHYTHSPTIQGERDTLLVVTNRYLGVSSQTTWAKGLLIYVHHSLHPHRLRSLGWQSMHFRMTE